MTQTKTGAFLSMGRLPQFFGQAALVASVLAGGASLLNAGGAMAAPGDSVSNFPPQPPVDPLTPNNGAVIDFVSGPNPSTSSGDVEFNYLGAIGGKKTWTIDTDFSPNLGATGGPQEFTYSLTAPSGENWLFAALSSNNVAGFFGTSITKQLCTDGTFTTCTPIPSLSLTDSGVTALVDISPSPKIYVKDVYNVNPNGLYDNFSNTFQTPGPLPILGAGAAFGFSRKLRSRIKAGRTA